MSKKNHLIIYAIAPNYRKLTVWIGGRMTHSRMSTDTFTPNKGLTRKERHAVIGSALFKNYGIPGPVYQP